MSEAPPEGWEAAYEAWAQSAVLPPEDSPDRIYWRETFRAGFLAARPAPGGEGDWVLVPREPTDEMIKGIEFAIYRYSDCDVRDAERGAPYAYRAMIAAAPPPPGEADVAGDRLLIIEALIEARRYGDALNAKVIAAHKALSRLADALARRS